MRGGPSRRDNDPTDRRLRIGVEIMNRHLGVDHIGSVRNQQRHEARRDMNRGPIRGRKHILRSCREWSEDDKNPTEDEANPCVIRIVANRLRCSWRKPLNLAGLT
jgi:hypothetical protein